jgi:hypothetical protein
MPGAGADGPFEVAVEPCNDRYAPTPVPDDEDGQEQVATLHADLDARVDTVHRAYSVGGAKGAARQLVITLGRAAACLVRSWVACVPGWDVTGTGVSDARRRPSSLSGLSSRDHLDDQGRSHRQGGGKNLTIRFGSPSSGIASVPECNPMG